MSNSTKNNDNTTTVTATIPSTDLPIDANIWTDEHEDVLNILYEATNQYYKRFHTAYSRYKRKLHNYRIPIIVMSSLSGFASILNVGYVPIEYGKWVSLAVGFINLMATVISLIETFKKIDQTMQQAYASFFAFKTLSDEIFIVLQTPRQDRKNGGCISVNKFFTRYQTAYSNIPLLDKNETTNFDVNKNKKLKNYDIENNIDNGVDNTLRNMEEMKSKINKINSATYSNIIEMNNIPNNYDTSSDSTNNGDDGGMTIESNIAK